MSKAAATTHRVCVCVLLCAIVSGCATPPSSAVVEFPGIAQARQKEGSFPVPDSLRMVRSGMTKDQVRSLLGVPHFHEGLWGVHSWNYILNLQASPETPVASCQYMVHFDDDMRVDGLHWKDPACEKQAAG